MLSAASVAAKYGDWPGAFAVRGTRTYDHERLEKPHYERTPEKVFRRFRGHGSDSVRPILCAVGRPRAGIHFDDAPSQHRWPKVIMYGQWLSAMRQDPGPLPFLQEALTIAKFEPSIYEIVRRFWPRKLPIICRI
jgi:hypothetical protein